MASQKKVVVRQMDGSLFWGYLPAQGMLDGENVQLLDTSGRVQPVPLGKIATISYVRDFNLNDSMDPERAGRRSFTGKPRGEGLWLRLHFANGDPLEGLAPLGMAFVDHLLENRCVAISPPDPKSNTYLVLVPRSALKDIETLGLVGPAAKQPKAAPSPSAQPKLFT